MKPVLCAAALVLLSACGDREASPTLADRAAAISAGMNVDTLDVGGREEQITFREATGGANFPVPFKARVPAPMAVTTQRTAIGESVVLTAARQGVWSLTLLPDSTDEETARTATRAAAETQGEANASSRDAAKAPAQALDAFLVTRAGYAGSVWLGGHAGRYFVVASEAPTATQAAFDVRVAYVLGHWTWTDDQSLLGDVPVPAP